MLIDCLLFSPSTYTRPRLDGLGATKVVREMEESLSLESVPIVALSAGAMKGDHEEGIAAGMTDYLTKPLNFKLVVETIEKYAGSSEMPQAA